MTLANDFKGEPKEFAIVVPVPTVLEKGQIHVGDRALVEHLDSFTAPRLVEYFDEDPCARVSRARRRPSASAPPPSPSRPRSGSGQLCGVTIEAKYTVGEYDILILSAQAEWRPRDLAARRTATASPPARRRVLGIYLKQGMKFFVAKVNLSQQQKLGFAYLRPIQIAYESPKFMLPIRLGMVNADGAQELFVYAITQARAASKTTNYRNVKLPTDQDVPEYVQAELPRVLPRDVRPAGAAERHVRSCTPSTRGT